MFLPALSYYFTLIFFVTLYFPQRIVTFAVPFLFFAFKVTFFLSAFVTFNSFLPVLSKDTFTLLEIPVIFNFKVIDFFRFTEDLPVTLIDGLVVLTVVEEPD